MVLYDSRFYAYRPGKECAVSPVVGIMLMLTITLILAAIISGFFRRYRTGTVKTSPVTI